MGWGTSPLLFLGWCLNDIVLCLKVKTIWVFVKMQGHGFLSSNPKSVPSNNTVPI